MSWENGETSPACWEPGSQEARRQTPAAAVGWRDAQRGHAQRRAGNQTFFQSCEATSRPAASQAGEVQCLNGPYLSSSPGSVLICFQITPDTKCVAFFPSHLIL